MTARVIDRATLAPGVCFISGDFNGPFIDTEVDIRGRGRVYLSLKALAPLVRDAGWVPREEVAEAIEEAEAVQAAAQEVSDDAAALHDLLDVIKPFLPEPEVVTREVGIFQDPRIKAENERLRAELKDIKLRLAEAETAVTALVSAAPPAPESEGSTQVEPGAAAPTTVTVEDQEVDLDTLLDRSAKDVIAVAEGWPADALAALAAREVERAEQASKDPRVTVLRLAEVDEEVPA